MKKHEEKALAPQEDTNAKMLAIKADAAAKQAELKELGVEVSDLVIPLVQLMQNTSEMVGDGKAKLGDIVNMQTGEILGSIDKPVKILPLKMFKTLRTYDVTSGFKFLREEPLVAGHNDKLDAEGKEGDLVVKRYHTFNYFVLVKQDLDKGEAFPSLIRFRSTGMNAGRALATHLYKRVHLRKLPYSQLVELSSRKEKKDTNVFSVFSIGNPQNASEVEMQAAQEWLATLATSSYRIDEKEEADVEDSRVQAAKPVVMDAGLGNEETAY